MRSKKKKDWIIPEKKNVEKQNTINKSIKEEDKNLPIIKRIKKTKK